MRKLVHMDSEIDLNPSTNSEQGNDSVISPAVVISKRPNKQGRSLVNVGVLKINKPPQYQNRKEA